ncbi:MULTISPECIES: hypothetical protein [Paenibacillus]|uniref:Uncharacterized protein n=1 Tax=Paenibacillus sabinae T27 TaxID=1268072 RepID=X4ZIM4_9BACL|nr:MULTISPECIES: hypothetical protein [Paenibacillus]AHV96565.1 hypothetical protein PSAB_08165 [Paenibacillus sabinae T27]NJJ40132.1 hypothetical protein [Paenibacillus apii]
MAKKPKVQENYKTPNEKFNAEFAAENNVASNVASKQGGIAKPVQKPQV